jgi:hypothetical protein
MCTRAFHMITGVRPSLSMSSSSRGGKGGGGHIAGMSISSVCSSLVSIDADGAPLVPASFKLRALDTRSRSQNLQQRAFRVVDDNRGTWPVLHMFTANSGY